MEKRKTSLLASVAVAALLAGSLIAGAQTGGGDAPRAAPGATQSGGGDSGGANDRGRQRSQANEPASRSQSDRRGGGSDAGRDAASDTNQPASRNRQTTGQDGERGNATRNRAEDRSRNNARDNASERSRTGQSARDRDQDGNRAQRDRDNDSDRSRAGANDSDRSRDPDRADRDRDGRDRDRDRDSADRDRNRDRDSDRADRDRDRNRDRADRDRASVSGSVSLDTRQETRVRETIMRRAPNRVTNVNFSISVGATVPRSARLAVLPPDVVSIVPRYRGYKYVVVRDEIVIVHPQTYKVVTVIRNGGSAATGSRPRSGERLSLSQTQRQLIRRHADRKVRGETRFSVSVGERIPDTVELYEFPDTVYTELPMLRTYRYVVVEDDVLLVDPDEHRIIEVID